MIPWRSRCAIALILAAVFAPSIPFQAAMARVSEQSGLYAPSTVAAVHAARDAGRSRVASPFESRGRVSAAARQWQSMVGEVPGLHAFAPLAGGAIAALLLASLQPADRAGSTLLRGPPPRI